MYSSMKHLRLWHRGYRRTIHCSSGPPYSVSPEDIHDFAELLLKKTYFQCHNSYYGKIEGATVGSTLSPTIANTYMEYFEKIAMDTLCHKPKFWSRYVDDTSVIWPH